MSSTFNSHTFQERGDAGKNNPQWDDPTIVVLKKIPGTSDTVIQVIGADVQRLAMPISCTASQLAALRGDKGATHALSSWSGANTDAFLEKIDTPIEVKPGVDLYHAVLHFIKQ